MLFLPLGRQGNQSSALNLVLCANEAEFHLENALAKFWKIWENG